MHDVGIKANTVTYNVLAGGLMKAGRADAAWDILQHMEAVGLKPDSITYNLMMQDFSDRVSILVSLLFLEYSQYFFRVKLRSFGHCTPR